MSARLGALCAAFLSAAAPAAAHVTLEQAEAAPGAVGRYVLRVPHGCGTAATTTLRVTIPEGVVDVQPMVKPGWRLAVTRAAYAAPVRVGQRELTEGVREIVWSGGELPSALYDEFVFRARFTQAPGSTVHVPVVQECAGGARESWTEVPAAGASATELRRPAPAIRIAGGAATRPPRAPGLRVGDLVIERPWTRATPPGARVAGGYLRVTNTGTTPDRLVGGALEGAERVEIHEMATEGGVMRMRPLAAGVEIGPGETVELRPGGLHVMFLGLAAPVQQGAPRRGRLVFERAGAVDLAFEVQPMGAGPPAAGGGEHDHH